jgi:hypothetical protein
MNKKLAITIGVVGGLSALGLLIYHFTSSHDCPCKKATAMPDDEPKDSVKRPAPVKPVAPMAEQPAQAKPKLYETVKETVKEKPAEQQEAPKTEQSLSAKPELRTQGVTEKEVHQHPAPAKEENITAIFPGVTLSESPLSVPKTIIPPAEPLCLPEEKTISDPCEKGDEFPLRLGSEGPRVERMQVFLLRNYGQTKVSGIFDAQTEDQLKRRLSRTTLDEQTYNRFKMGNPVLKQVLIR